jgi:hypothetical protein
VKNQLLRPPPPPTHLSGTALISAKYPPAPSPSFLYLQVKANLKNLMDEIHHWNGTGGEYMNIINEYATILSFNSWMENHDKNIVIIANEKHKIRINKLIKEENSLSHKNSVE